MIIFPRLSKPIIQFTDEEMLVRYSSVHCIEVVACAQVCVEVGQGTNMCSRNAARGAS